MALTFSLLSESWLPVRFAGEATGREVSISEALARAHEIERLADPSPIVTAALHRLLVAILHAAHDGPRDMPEWVALWERGSFDLDLLAAYFDRVRAAFDLFDPIRPFYQAPGLPRSAATTVAKLGSEYSAGNNPLLFDHSSDDKPPALEPAAAARLLVAQQSFAIGGLITRLPGDPPSAVASHLVKAAVILTLGRNLFETLVLNMVAVDGEGHEPFSFDPEKDAPAWERGTPTATTARPPDGYLDLLTWQSRRVLLFPDDDGLVRHAAILAGDSFPPQMEPHDFETMAAYAKRDKIGWVPLGFRVEKVLWRDSLALLEASDTVQIPASIRWLARLKDSAYLEPSSLFSVAALGFCTDRAKIFLWRAEELPLPLAYLDNSELLAQVRHAVAAAEAAGRALRWAAMRLASHFLSPEGNADPARVRALADSLAPERGYWPALTLPFRMFVQALAASPTDAQAVKSRFARAIQHEAMDAFDRVSRVIEESPGRGHRAVAKAAPGLSFRIRESLQPIQPEPQPDRQEVTV
ncbi:MAG: type I-E CRISPR-associated protein Cse1/CasA [Dehalococcoidia bacterium]|nr:type I-E CRISPR-associated protein Cse1/CasA [Dehalococcoidia bacterium]